MDPLPRRDVAVRIAVRETRDVRWPDPVAALRREPFFWWLDSALPGPGIGRWSFAGADPWAVVRSWGARSVADVRRPAWPGVAPGRHARAGDPLETLAAWLPVAPRDAAPGIPFAGGAVGVLAYELAESLERIALQPPEDPALPDLCFLLVDRLLAFDHLEGRAFAVGLGLGEDGRSAADRAECAAGELAVRAARARGPALPGPGPVGPRRRSGPPSESLDEAAHAKATRRALEHVAEGDVYQVCLTRRLERAFAGDPWRFYAALRRASPAPFGACLALPDAWVASSSPERFLQIGTDGWAESRPIKGTRPRRTDPAADAAEQRALRDSPKDRAENLMIVDLVRNDLGRVCELGSVHVPELMAVERYATVFQMVSTVRGRLRADCDVFDAIRATFPPGSMTGAPKLAAMELLARLEPCRRGFYAGALGHLDARGGCGLSVVIRTAWLADRRARLHTGGAIVADSEPAAEWREGEDKIRALLEALDACEAGP